MKNIRKTILACGTIAQASVFSDLMDTGENSIWAKIADKRKEMLDPKNFGLMVEAVQDSYNIITG